MTDPIEARLAAEMQLVYERSVGVNGDPVTWWQAFAREVMRGLAGRPLDDEQPDVPLAIGPAADLALAAAARSPDAHLFTVETLIDALAGTNINERDRQAYRDIFRTQAEDAIRYAKQAAKEAERE